MDIHEKFRGVECPTAHAAAALTGGRLVTKTTAAAVDGNPVVNVTGAGLRADGVAAQDAASGTKVRVIRAGAITPIEAGATIAVGDVLESDASGRVITRTTGVAVGIAHEAATVGNLALVDFRPALV